MLRNSTLEPRPYWDFTLSHQPNCSSVTDEALRTAIYGFWPQNNGVARIPYTFSSIKDYYLSENIIGILSFYIYGALPISFDPALELKYQYSVRYVLNKWQQLSNGTLEFFEVSSSAFKKNKKGISFNIGSINSMNQKGIGGITHINLDNSGHIKNAFITYPNSSWYWSPQAQSYSLYGTAFIASTISHEIGHALGLNLDGLSHPEVITPLTNITDGVFCTVMAYEDLFQGTKGACQANCMPGLAVYPGQLDQRMLALEGTAPRCEIGVERMMLTLNSMLIDPFLNSMGYSFLWSATQSFLQHVSYKPNEYLLSSFTSKIAADGIFFATLFYMEPDIWPALLFLGFAATKHLSESQLNQYSLIMKILAFLDAIYLINLSLGIARGNCPLPLTLSLLMSVLGTVAGYSAGQDIGKSIGEHFSLLTQYVYRVRHRAEPPESVMPQTDPSNLIHISEPQEPAVQVEVVVPTISTHRNSFFKSIGNYFCSRCKQEPNIENQLDAEIMREQEGAIEMQTYGAN